MGGVADWLPEKQSIVVKDMALAKDLVPGNPFSRYDTENGGRKYCSAELWDQVEDKYVIPEGDQIPKPMVVCQACENESWKDENGECGMCGVPMFVCPAEDCEVEIHGRPDECPECGAGYRWPDKTEDDF